MWGSAWEDREAGGDKRVRAGDKFRSERWFEKLCAPRRTAETLHMAPLMCTTRVLGVGDECVCQILCVSNILCVTHAQSHSLSLSSETELPVVGVSVHRNHRILVPKSNVRPSRTAETIKTSRERARARARKRDEHLHDVHGDAAEILIRNLSRNTTKNKNNNKNQINK